MRDEKQPLPDFVVDAPDTIEWPVTVTHPIDGGDLASFAFTGIFKRMSETELDALLGEPVQEALPPVAVDAGVAPEALAEPLAALAPAKPMAEILRENVDAFARVLVGWRGPRAADGSAAAFTAERLRAVTTGPNGPFFSAGVWHALAEIRHGARLGN